MYKPLSLASTRKLTSIAKSVRKDILEISHKARAGHIGPALSITDILTVLLCAVVKRNKTNVLDPNRDRLILSKGHAASALYAILHACGRISRKQLLSYCQDGGAFGLHPEYNPDIGIELTSGSLGLGLSVAGGIAYSLKYYSQNPSPPKVFVILSDAELNEGSTWEAIMFASHHKLGNLVVIVDDNGQQAFGKTAEVLRMRPLARKWKAFGWNTRGVNGHNISDLYRAFSSLQYANRPHAIIAKTVSGYGVKFMHRKIAWHYKSLDEDLLKKALADL